MTIRTRPSLSQPDHILAGQRVGRIYSHPLAVLGCPGERSESRGAITNENCGRRIRLCRPGAGSLSGGKRQRRDVHRQGCGEGPQTAPRRHAHLRARPRRDGQAQPGREAARVHDRPSARGPRRQHRLHRRRHAAARRRLGRSVARARRRARHREGDERLQGDRRQEHGSGRHGRSVCAR